MHLLGQFLPAHLMRVFLPGTHSQEDAIRNVVAVCGEAKAPSVAVDSLRALSYIARDHKAITIGEKYNGAGVAYDAMRRCGGDRRQNLAASLSALWRCPLCLLLSRVSCSVLLDVGLRTTAKCRTGPVDCSTTSPAPPVPACIRFLLTPLRCVRRLVLTACVVWCAMGAGENQSLVMGVDGSGIQVGTDRSLTDKALA